jgi:DNA-binding MarR family transcriptional regulator
MTADPRLQPQDCNCLAVRQAARHVTQFYDQHLAPTGLRTTQFSILVKLRRLGPMTINALAGDLVMDRTTLGRNILPLERDGLIVVKPKELHLTAGGAARVRAGVKLWAIAQSRFDDSFGPGRASELRALLRTLVATDLDAGHAAATLP